MYVYETGGTITKFAINTIDSIIFYKAVQGVFTCGTSLVSDFDGNTYKTVSIGTQCWMAENLNIGTKILGTANQANNSIIEKYCYNDADSNCTTYGGLYQWAELVQYLNGATNTSTWFPVPTGNIHGICPNGWHIPTDAEWTTLEIYLVTNGYNYDGTTVGNKLAKSLADTTLWYTSAVTGAVGNTDYSAKRNITGFTGLPGSSRGSGGSYFSLTYQGLWWSATEYDPNKGFCRSMSSSQVSVNSGNSYKDTGFSVRCLKD